MYKIASIAYDAGFNSLSTFNEVFKKLTGKTPSDYRKEMLKNTANNGFSTGICGSVGKMSDAELYLTVTKKYSHVS